MESCFPSGVEQRYSKHRVHHLSRRLGSCSLLARAVAFLDSEVYLITLSLRLETWDTVLSELGYFGRRTRISQKVSELKCFRGSEKLSQVPRGGHRVFWCRIRGLIQRASREKAQDRRGGQVALTSVTCLPILPRASFALSQTFLQPFPVSPAKWMMTVLASFVFLQDMG